MKTASQVNFKFKVQVKVPVVTRFFCPPEMPRTISSPIIVSAHMSSPSNCMCKAWSTILRSIKHICSIFRGLGFCAPKWMACQRRNFVSGLTANTYSTARLPLEPGNADAFMNVSTSGSGRMPASFSRFMTSSSKSEAILHPDQKTGLKQNLILRPKWQDYS